MKRGALLLGMILCASSFVHAVDKDTVLKKSEAEIKEWSAKADDLQRRAEKAGAKTRVKLDQEIKVVQDQLDKARWNLTQLEHSSQGTWEKFHKGSDEALRDVKKAYKTALTYLNKSEKKENVHE